MMTPESDPLFGARPPLGRSEAEAEPANGENGGEGGESGPSALRPYDPTRDGPGVSLPFAAMAEALRANAEALRRIDANQRKIAEAVRKNEKASQVVTSTRNLNETFRGLSDIQRGLLDALLKDRSGRRGLPVAILALVLVAALLGYLLYTWRYGEKTVPAGVHEAVVARADRLAQESEELRAAVQGSRAEAGEWKARLDERAGKLTVIERENGDLAQEIERLQEELIAKEASLKEYLVMKGRADTVGIVTARNAELEDQVRHLRDRLDRLETERERLLSLVADKKLEELEGDPDELIRQAKKLGIIPEEPKAGADGQPAGPVPLSPRVRRRVVLQINRLLRQAQGDQTYEILDFSALQGLNTLMEVRVGRYRDAKMVSSLVCRELTLVPDPDRDTLELRMSGGHIENFGRPGEKIPFEAGAHSVFLRDVGLAAWLRRVSHSISVGEDGLLTWKTTPS